MEEDQKTWIEEALNSLEGMQRATPRKALWNKIEAQHFGPPIIMISRQNLRMTAAAAVVLLCLNAMIMRIYWQNKTTVLTERLVETTEASYLISDYELYEE